MQSGKAQMAAPAKPKIMPAVKAPAEHDCSRYDKPPEHGDFRGDCTDLPLHGDPAKAPGKGGCAIKAVVGCRKRRLPRTFNGCGDGHESLGCEFTLQFAPDGTSRQMIVRDQ